MIVLALLCLIIAAAVIVFMLTVGFNQTLDYSFFAGDFSTRPIWIFVAGVVTTLLILAGLDFFRRGTKRKVAQRREIRRLRKVEQTSGAPVSSGASQSGPHHQSHEETLVRETRQDGPTDRI